MGLLAFVWLELVYPHSTELGPVRLWCAVYVAAMLLGGALWGDDFYERGDPFEVYSTLASKLSIWGRRADLLVVRSPLANLDTVVVRPGLVGVVAVLFGSTAYDSFQDSQPWVRFTNDHLEYAQLLNHAGPAGLLRGCGLILTAGSMLTGVGPEQSRRALPDLFAHSVVPIIVGYVVAHYLSYLVETGQDTIIKMSDPMGDGSNLLGTGDWKVNFWLSYHPTLLATTKVVAVVVGHILGVVAAHDRAITAAAEAAPGHRAAPHARGDDRLHGRRALPPLRRLTPRRPVAAGPGTRAAATSSRARASGRVTGLDQRAACDQGAVDGGPVVGEEVHPGHPREAPDHVAHLTLGPPQAGPVLVHDQPHRGRRDDLAEVHQAPGQPGQPDRVRGPDHDDLVGDAERPEGHGVARRPAAEVASRVLLEAEAGVDHHVAVRPERLDEVLDRAGAHLDPAVRTRQPGHHRQVRAQRAGHARPSLGERSGRREARGREEPGDLVEHAELLRQRAAVGIGVDQDRVRPRERPARRRARPRPSYARAHPAGPTPRRPDRARGRRAPARRPASAPPAAEPRRA